MLGDGHICKNNKESGVTLGIERKQELIDFMKAHLTKLNVTFWESESIGSRSIRWSNGNNEKLNIYRDFVYNDKDEKEYMSPCYIYQKTKR